MIFYWEGEEEQELRTTGCDTKHRPVESLILK